VSTAPKPLGPELVDEQVASRPNAPKPQRPLPTERVTVARQLDILRAYAAASQQGSKPVGNREVATLAGMTPESVSGCNGFLASLNLIRKSENAWVVSSEVLDFFRAYEWNKETAPHKLAPAMTASWFGQAMTTRLSFKPLTEDEAIAMLAEASAAVPQYLRSLKMLLEFLEVTGVIAREGNMLRNASSPATAPSPNGEAKLPEMKNPDIQTPDTSLRPPKLSTAFAQLGEGAMRFNVSFTVDMAEMANWRAERIAAFFNGIAQVLAAKAEVEKSSTRE
jgi:hypothetical protein